MVSTGRGQVDGTRRPHLKKCRQSEPAGTGADALAAFAAPAVARCNGVVWRCDGVVYERASMRTTCQGGGIKNRTLKQGQGKIGKHPDLKYNDQSYTARWPETHRGLDQTKAA